MRSLCALRIAHRIKVTARGLRAADPTAARSEPAMNGGFAPRSGPLRDCKTTARDRRQF